MIYDFLKKIERKYESEIKRENMEEEGEERIFLFFPFVVCVFLCLFVFQSVLTTRLSGVV